MKDNFRRPTRAESDALLLSLADRMERVASDFAKAAIVDDHRKAGHASYLNVEAANIRAFVRREKRLV